MTIPEIERAEAGIEVKAAAVSNLLPPVHRQAFELPLDGVLVMAATKIRSRLLTERYFYTNKRRFCRAAATRQPVMRMATALNVSVHLPERWGNRIRKPNLLFRGHQ